MLKPALFYLLFLVSCNTKRSIPTTGLSELKRCSIDGSVDSVYCGFRSVWENRSTRSGRKLELYVTVIPALNREPGNTPIFYLEGGPGVAASKNAGFFADKSIPYRKDHDIVLIDIRGTGKSNPLNCYSLQFDATLQDQLSEMYPIDAVKSCYDSLSKRADLTQYTTSIIAQDIEEIREWLGYKKIQLFGLSYGTKLAQEYMRRFPDAVESAVLMSPVVMNSKMPLHHAAFAHAALRQLFADCKTDLLCATKFPAIEMEFQKLMERGREQPFVVEHTFLDSTRKQVIITWDAFQSKIRSLLYMPVKQRVVPHIIHQAYNNNWRPFLQLFKESPTYDNFIADGLYLCITCSEDVPFIDTNESISESLATFGGTYRVDQQRTACAHWARGGIPTDFLQPVTTAVSTLIVVGGKDPVTPVKWATAIATKIPGAKLIVIPEMAHTFDGLNNETCIDNIVLAFLRDPQQAQLDTSCLVSMKPPRFKIE
ncbi:MAG: alpha/beta fold hydrolase [Chitinophagaceae bacterium]|nr:alpha/beta fold hydrolase [Chitinophagaceae bacterium]